MNHKQMTDDILAEIEAEELREELKAAKTAAIERAKTFLYNQYGWQVDAAKVLPVDLVVILADYETLILESQKK